MGSTLLTSPEELKRYGAWVTSHPNGSLWQSLEWKTYQESLGRQTRVYAAMDGETIRSSALVVIDRTSLGLSTWEIPRGPVGAADGLLRHIADDAKTNGAVSLFFSPLDATSAGSASGRFIHPEATRILDLRLSDDDLLAQMKPKGRYNIGIARKHGVTVERSDDVDAYARLAEETARRDGYRAAGRTGYEHFLRDLPGSFLLLASMMPENTQKTPSEERLAQDASASDKTVLAGLLGVVWGTTGIYYYGASSNEQRELMAPYLLQWEAMHLCRERGCTSYDLFGVAPENAVDHPWSGVSDFKAKFGGDVVTYPPEREMVLRPVAKGLLAMKRKLLG